MLTRMNNIESHLRQKMSERLANLLRSFPAFSESDIENGLACMKPRSFKKDDFLMKEGKTCDWIAYIGSGIVRNFYYSSKGEEITYCLTFPNAFISAYSSFIRNKETFENLQAISDVEALIIRKKDYQALINSSRAWLEFSNHFAEQSYVLMEERLLSLQMESAEQRYRSLLRSSPEYLEHIPLKYIASYLGITPRHLSRLRKDNPA